MKKYFGITLLMLSIALMASCCKKDSTQPDPAKIIPTEINSISDLAGQWDFVNFNDSRIGDCTECSTLIKSIFGRIPVIVSFNFNGSSCIVTNHCYPDLSFTGSATYLGKSIVQYYPSIEISDRKYTIVSYNPPTLVLSFGYVDTGEYFLEKLTVKKVIN